MASFGEPSLEGRRPVQISHPVQKLFPLEVRQVEPLPENAVVTQPAGDGQRPRSEAAVTGELRTRLVDQCWNDDNDLQEVNTGQGGSATEFVLDITELFEFVLVL